MSGMDSLEIFDIGESSGQRDKQNINEYSGIDYQLQWEQEPVRLFEYKNHECFGYITANSMPRALMEAHQPDMVEDGDESEWRLTTPKWMAAGVTMGGT